jgi:hypothetical protein
MRRRVSLSAVLLPAVLLLLSATAVAQKRPNDLQPLPEVPPPPPMVDNAPAPQVTIVTRGPDKVEEYRVNGKLYMMKVTPPNGKPYYLVDNQGDGKWTRQDGTDTGLRVPQWVITTF